MLILTGYYEEGPKIVRDVCRYVLRQVYPRAVALDQGGLKNHLIERNGKYEHGSPVAVSFPFRIPPLSQIPTLQTQVLKLLNLILLFSFGPPVVSLLTFFGGGFPY